MTRILLVTNDFPPRRGGIQSYLEQFARRLVDTGQHDLTVYAPQWRGSEDYDRAAPFRVVRHPGTLMLPQPGVDRRMRSLIRTHDIETVWFGAAAPLALLASQARSAGAEHVVASTHGHEVGWSMLPVARRGGSGRATVRVQPSRAGNGRCPRPAGGVQGTHADRTPRRTCPGCSG